MLAFEVWVNGKKLCTASTATNCVLSTIVSWADRNPDTIDFHVGGLAADNPKHHTRWNTPNVKIGDEIRIRVVDTDKFDKPDQRIRGRRLIEDSETQT